MVLGVDQAGYGWFCGVEGVIAALALPSEARYDANDHKFPVVTAPARS